MTNVVVDIISNIFELAFSAVVAAGALCPRGVDFGRIGVTLLAEIVQNNASKSAFSILLLHLGKHSSSLPLAGLAPAGLALTVLTFCQFWEFEKLGASLGFLGFGHFANGRGGCQCR